MTDATRRGGRNPRDALSDTPHCWSTIAFVPTAIADHQFGSETTHPDHNVLMASNADGFERSAASPPVNVVFVAVPA
jgi:hypothetical protein